MKRLQACVLTAVAVGLTSLVCGADEFAARTYKSGNQTLPYRIHRPEKIETGGKYPLVVLFHGAGERGDDNKRQLVHGSADILKFAKAAKQPIFFIAPQCPRGQQWVNTPWGKLSHTMPKEPSKSMTLAIGLIKKTIADLPVDDKRVYVTGLSMGGFATWDIIQRMPNYFAAAMPICGGADTAEAAKLKNTPIWCFHGGNDRVVKTQRSRDMVAAIKKAGGAPKYTEYSGVGHNSWTRTFRDKEVLTWLFAQRKHAPIKKELFKVEGRPAFLILPTDAKANVESPVPWVWYAPTLRGLPGRHEKWMFDQFLDKGIAIAGVDVGESYGSPKGRAVYSALYKQLVEKRGLAKKACLLARSRGGLMLYNWAAENPNRVACIAGIYPVCNLTSYPGLNRACGAYGMTKEQLAATLTDHNPIDRLALLAKAKTPIFHIHGDRDGTVPLDENSGELKKRYEKLGGAMTLEIVKGQGHNLWPGWFHSQKLVGFVITHAGH
ncbi:MAG: dienelactone hydrolase family protein [Phycisphaerae bacterium]|jgi:dipeptidyl aminopeptidase/acylaminoacyl peptidase|nr:dienelactone hydrolase family protein [Phycisphaerae bacterium]